jgi:c-di-GMP-binding flagellar brake protein YcgR
MIKDSRSFPRKSLRFPAQLQVDGGPALNCKTIDISLGGISLMVPSQLPPGLPCSFVFEARLNGQIRKIAAKAKVVYAILSGTEGFRTGLSIVEIDSASNKALAELMI